MKRAGGLRRRSELGYRCGLEARRAQFAKARMRAKEMHAQEDAVNAAVTGWSLNQ